MGKIIDITGQTFGYLTVIKPTRVNGRFGWQCQCICGKKIDVDSGNLRSGKTQSCGCQTKNLIGKKNKKDKVGQRIGSLTVIRDSGQRKNGSIVWECRCDCGTICYIPTSNLRENHTTSCGCKQYQLISEKLKLKLLGKQYGLLTVIEELPSSNHESKWKCRCECGNIITTTGWHLTSNIIQSCGCLKSKGEQKIQSLLIENNIPFERQKRFDTCLSDSQKPLYFDFFIDNKYLIEYDGEQHFLDSPKGYYSEEKIKTIRRNDSIKNEWCKNNNISLIRIKYTDFDNITIEKLLLQEE